MTQINNINSVQYQLPGNHWLYCSACWELWTVLILFPQSDLSRRPLLLWVRVGQTSPSGCSKTPWSYWTTWWAERWCSAWTEETGKWDDTVINLPECEKKLPNMFYVVYKNKVYFITSVLLFLHILSFIEIHWWCKVVH